MLHCAGVCAKLDHGKPLAVGSGTLDGADVSAVYFFHDYGSEDDGEVEEMAVHCGGDCGFRRDDFAAGAGGVRAVLCVVFGGASGALG